MPFCVITILQDGEHGDTARTLMYMSAIPRRRLSYFCAAALLSMAGGCATITGYQAETRVNDDLSFRRAFNNSHDWGPDYLAGPTSATNVRQFPGDYLAVPQPQALPSDRPLPRLP